MKQPKENPFERAATERMRGGFFGELWGFMRQNKKWWLLPILVVLLLLGLLMILSGTALAPFIYTLF
jgi:drug/metabolite transporter superfamily protein YnfA